MPYRRDAGAARPTGARHAGRDGLKLSEDAAMNADSKGGRFSAAAVPTWHFSCAAWLCPASCNKERMVGMVPAKQWVPWAQLSMLQHVRIGTGPLPSPRAKSTLPLLFSPSIATPLP